LAKMTEIILESAGAHFAGVVIESEDESGSWGFAASGTQDAITADPLPLQEVTDKTSKQVVLYTLRFRETVFINNVLKDERFSANATTAKAIISLPIVQGENLLGILYLEGPPNAFTKRNFGVLQLFRGQVGISISNALLFRRLRKVSAKNTSMIEAQKKALKDARAAEEKARIAEMEALRNVKLKEEAAKAKSMFLANVSHELRTPLNGVIGMSELLKGTALNPEQEGFADSIRVCADTLLTVINDILDFSKLEAGKMKLFSVPLNLHETITEVVRALSYMNIEKGLQTVVQLDLDRQLLVLGDPGM
jgi:signal transduction histidine kinase